jgi:hypothetical protein
MGSDYDIFCTASKQSASKSGLFRRPSRDDQAKGAVQVSCHQFHTLVVHICILHCEHFNLSSVILNLSSSTCLVVGFSVGVRVKIYNNLRADEEALGMDGNPESHIIGKAVSTQYG